MINLSLRYLVLNSALQAQYVDQFKWMEAIVH